MINAYAQVPDCNFIKVRGPLLVCSSGTTTHKYHILHPPLPILSSTWKVLPTSAGTTSNPQLNFTDVIWNSNAVSLHAFLLFSYVLQNTGGTTISGTDTLWPQACCSAPAGAVSIRDLDDEVDFIITPAEKVFNAFNIINPVTGLGNCTLNSTTKQVFVNGGTYFIEGQLNLNTTNLVLTGCTLIMGSGAVIYTPFGSNTGISGLGDFVATDTHFKGTSCGMWQGIISSTDTKLYFSGVTIDDAEYAINWGGCTLAIICDNTTFNNNFISIYTHPKTFVQNSYQNLGNGQTRFRNCTFDSNGPMLLPTFNGQRGIPL